MAEQHDNSSSPPEAAQSRKPEPPVAPGPAATPPPKKIVVERRRGFFARWLARLAALVIILVVLLLASLAGITLLLRSDLPRSIAESAATNALGLELRLGDLDIGWGGRVSVQNFEARLPPFGQSQGENLLEIKRIEAQLDSLPMVALGFLRGRTPGLRRLVIEAPTLHATQAADGSWNLQRAITLISSARGGSKPTGGGRQLPPLPELQVTDGALMVRDSAGKEARIGGFSVSGTRHNPLVYQLEAGSSESLKISGELFPASGRRQQLRIELAGLNEELRAIFGLPPAGLWATWTGGLTDDGVEGTLQVELARFDQMHFSGGLRVVSEEGVTRILPVDVTAEGLPVVGSAVIPHGVIDIGAQLRAQGLLISTMGGQILVRSAMFNPATRGGTLDVAFRDLHPRPQDTLDGELVADGGFDSFGEPYGRAELRGVAAWDGTRLERLDAELLADGSVIGDWRTLDLLLRLRDTPVLVRENQHDTVLPRIEAPILVRLGDDLGGRIEIPQLHSLDPQVIDVAGSAVYYTADGGEHRAGDYRINLTERGLPVKLPRRPEPVPSDLALDIEGRYALGADGADAILPLKINRLYGLIGAAMIEASGQYAFRRQGNEPPLDLQVTLTRDATPGGVAAGFGLPYYTRMGGALHSSFDITGDPATGHFTGTGAVEAEDLSLGKVELGNVVTDLTVILTPQTLTVSSLREGGGATRAQFLGAGLDFEAVLPFRDEQPGHITVAMDDLNLGLVADAFSGPGYMTGTLDGRVHIDLTGLDMRHAEARGWFVIEEPMLGTVQPAQRIVIGTVPDANVPEPQGKQFLSGGRIELPVEFQQIEELAPGPTLIAEQRVLKFDLIYDLSSPKELGLRNLRGEDYPIFLPTAQGGRYLQASFDLQPSDVAIDFDHEVPWLSGRLALATDIWTGAEPFNLGLFGKGEARVSAGGGRIDIGSLLFDLGDVGFISGGGTFNPADFTDASRLFLHGRTLNLEQISRRLGWREGLTGVTDFSLTIQPGPGERPRGDVLVDLAFSATDAHWRGLDIEQGQVMAYLSRELPAGQQHRGWFDYRLITTERLHLVVAGGEVDGFARLRRRNRAALAELRETAAPDDWYFQGTLEARGLDAAQLGRLAGHNVSGVLDLSAVAYGNLTPTLMPGQSEQDLPWLPLNGVVTSQVTRGELANIKLFDRAIDLANAVTQTQQFDTMQARLRLEEGNTYIETLEAFVDGIDIRMTGRLLDIYDVPQIDATGVVFARPLAQIRLPFFREADDILTAVQSNATAFRATGLLHDANVTNAAWTEVTETLRVLLPGLKAR